MMPAEPESKSNPPRKAISRRLRFEILRRDDNTCRYCGGRAPDVALTVDHVVPVALGGTDDPTNLVAACKDCNAGKSSSSPDAAIVAQVSQDALRWAAAMEQTAAVAARREQAIFEYVDAFDYQWHQWGWGPDRRPISRPKNWESSVRHWHAVGLPVELLRDAVRIAMVNDKIDSADTWRYFCGVAWGKVRQLQAEAEASL